jgi:hypothetical protein
MFSLPFSRLPFKMLPDSILCRVSRCHELLGRCPQYSRQIPKEQALIASFQILLLVIHGHPFHSALHSVSLNNVSSLQKHLVKIAPYVSQHQGYLEANGTVIVFDLSGMTHFANFIFLYFYLEPHFCVIVCCWLFKC